MNKSTAVIVITVKGKKLHIRQDGSGLAGQFAEQMVLLAKAAIEHPEVTEQIKGASDGLNRAGDERKSE